MKRVVMLACLLLCSGGSLAAQPSGAGANWPSHGGGTDESDYSRLQQIDTTNVDKLGLAWSLDLAGETTLEATPLAVDGVLYFTGAYSKVYAVDAARGKLLWSYDPEVWRYHPAKMRYNLAVNRGVAYASGRIFAGALDGRLIALAAKTGRLLWSVQATPPDSPQTITGAPRTFNGKVIIGQAGADFGARGYVTAYDQATGRQVWRFYVTPGAPDQNRGDPAMEHAAATWHGEYWKTGTGGAVWDSIAFDPEFNRIYIGTGNAGPYDPDARSPGGGDNLYTAAIVALDAGTGKYVWHYQINPRDSWDYDCTQQMTLADLVIAGQQRKVLMQAPKNGFFYVLDRQSGKLISAEKIGKATWADRIDIATGRPVEKPNIRYETGAVVIWPSPGGAHSWMSMSFSPKTGLVYIPTMQIGARYTREKAHDDNMGGDVTITMLRQDADDGKGALLAWDPVQQKPRWKVPRDRMWNGGTLATAGNLVFQGTADGAFSAYDAASGKRLWHVNAGLGIISAPITYMVQGRQYVSVLVGYGASNVLGSAIMDAGWKFGAQPRRLETFALGGTAVLAPTAPPDMTIAAVDDPSLQIDPADAAAGAALFNARCSACHGLDVVSASGPAPDLRESRLALSRDSLWHVLHDGALLQAGMPRYDELSATQVRQIHAFIRAQAREALVRKTAR